MRANPVIPDTRRVGPQSPIRASTFLR
jgi:hypothetical protein